MNKQEFLAELKKGLSKLPPAETEEILQDYEEHFEFALAEGKTEQEAAGALGNPKQLAKELLADYHIEQLKTTYSTGAIFRAIWSVIGLGFVNLVLVLGPFLLLVGLLFSGWMIGLSFTLSPLLVLINGFVLPETFSWFDLFISIALCGLGIFISLGMYYLSILFKNGSVRYLKFNVAIVKGGITRD